MVPRKKVRSLVDITTDSLTKTISVQCRKPEVTANVFAEIKDMLEFLPVHLLEDLILRLTNLLIGKDKTIVHFINSFKCFPIRKLTKLNFSRLFHGFRLSRSQNAEFKQFCRGILSQSINLVQLVLIGKCTDELLRQLGESCHNLRDLNIAHGDLTDAGLKELVPREGQVRCSNLVILDITKCWNLENSCEGPVHVIRNLPKLKRLCFYSMRAIANQLAKEDKGKSYELDYFGCTEQNYVEETSSDGSLKGVGFDVISQIFPRVSTLKLLISADKDLASLTPFTELRHVELEVADDLGPGFKSFFQHSSTANLNQLVLMVVWTNAEALQLIADNCLNLKVFKFTGGNYNGAVLEGEEKLISRKHHFQHLNHLEFRLFGSGLASSDESGDERSSGEVKEELFFFFFNFTSNLQQITFHCNSNKYMSAKFLRQLLARNPLQYCDKVYLSSPNALPLHRDSVELLMESLPALKCLHIASWEGIKEADINEYKSHAKQENLDIEFV